jgi:hypothetical protein
MAKSGRGFSGLIVGIFEEALARSSFFSIEKRGTSRSGNADYTASLEIGV